MRGRAGAASLATACALLGSATAQAELPEDKAAADALFDQGRKLFNAGDYAKACEKFAESVRLAPGVGGMLWLADCHQQLGRTATAWSEFRDAAAFAAQHKDSAREKVARRHMAELEPKLSKLVIVVPKDHLVADLEVKRDDVPIGAGAWGTELPVDPGPHTVYARAPGYETWQKQVVLLAGTASVTATITVPLLVRSKVVEPTATATAAAQSDTGTRDAPASGKSGGSNVLRPIGLAAAGVGLVGVGLGAYFGLKASSKQDDSAPHCSGNFCDPEGRSLRGDAIDAGNASTVLFVAGGVLVAGGLTLFFLAPRLGAKTAVTPLVGPRAAGAGFSGSW
jgi:serine/threonine-protein kinase